MVCLLVRLPVVNIIKGNKRTPCVPAVRVGARGFAWVRVGSRGFAGFQTLFSNDSFRIFLQWDMFRLPELDCWQTMLKRLYMKELEQVVFWFEEYRLSMQQEMERREREMGIMRIANAVIDQRMKKTDV